MTKIKELRAKHDKYVRLVDFLNLFTTDKPKYLEMICRLTEKLINDGDWSNFDSYCYILRDEFGLEVDEISGLSSFDCFLLFNIIQNLFPIDALTDFKKFCAFNEQGLIKNNDLQSYTSFEEIQSAVIEGEYKLLKKELESQCIKVLDNDEWLIIRPLTHLSSKKYGAGTKWCTASRDQDSSFDQYASTGILIYIINKKTNVKFAFYKDEEDTSKIYDAADDEHDSFDVDLPYDIVCAIRNENKTRPNPNSEYLDPKIVEKDYDEDKDDEQITY